MKVSNLINKKVIKPNVIVFVLEETTQNIHSKDTKTGFCLNSKDSLNAFVQNSISHISNAFSVGCDLSENVRHLLACPLVLCADPAEQPEDLHLQERVGHSAHVVLGCAC